MELRNGDSGSDEGSVGKATGCGSFVAGCGIALVVSLVVGGLVALRAWSVERGKTEATRETLRKTRDLILIAEESGADLPRADGSGADWTGQAALRTVMKLGDLNDGWGNPLRYRCPGPVHKQGWDLYSCGPNGKDDHGTFDDIGVGGDVARVTSSR
jgi:hypothetical protein